MALKIEKKAVLLKLVKMFTVQEQRFFYVSINSDAATHKDD